MFKVYVFKTPFDFAKGGSSVTLSELHIKAPTAKVSNLCAQMHMEFNRCSTVGSQELIAKLSPDAIKALAESNTEEEKPADEEGEDKKEKKPLDIAGVKETFLAGNANLPVLFDTLRKILTTQGQAKFDDEDTLVSKATWESIPYGELENILYFFIANFIVTST